MKVTPPLAVAPLAQEEEDDIVILSLRNTAKHTKGSKIRTAALSLLILKGVARLITTASTPLQHLTRIK